MIKKKLLSIIAVAFTLLVTHVSYAQQVTALYANENAPLTAPASSAVGSGGSCTAGAHTVAVTIVGNYLGQSYESGLSSGATATCIASDSLSLSAIPVGSGYATARNVYISKAGTTGPLFFAQTIADNTSTTATFTLADTNLGTQWAPRATPPMMQMYRITGTLLQPAFDNSQSIGDTTHRVKLLNNITFTAPATAATLTLGSGKTIALNGSITLTGTDSQTYTLPTTTATLARTDAANTFTGVQTMTSPVIATGAGFTNATSGTLTVAPPTGALGTPTVTMPALTGALGTGYSCGASLAAAGACANTALAGTFHFIYGTFLLSGSTSTITGISPAFTSATSFVCVANDITTRANPVQAIPGSGSTVVITNTTGATDLIAMLCYGN